MNRKGGYIYIMSNKLRTVLYIGVTTNLENRVQQHKDEHGSNFTEKYNCGYLLYFEFYTSIVDAIKREKQLKKWKRSWKEDLIKKHNPKLRDLSNGL